MDLTQEGPSKQVQPWESIEEVIQGICPRRGHQRGAIKGVILGQSSKGVHARGIHRWEFIKGIPILLGPINGSSTTGIHLRGPIFSVPARSGQ